MKSMQLILENKFNKNDWVEFLDQCFNAKLNLIPEVITLDSNPFKLNTCEKLGTCETEDNRIIGFYYIELHKEPDRELDIESNKVGLRNMLRSIWKNYVDGALIVFDQPDTELWRFSYVSDTKSYGVTASKRYTYVLGKGKQVRTATERFEQLLQKKKEIELNDIAEAFSVEKLTKEFYKELFTWYDYALKIVKFPNSIDDDKNNPIMLIRLITRLIFVWFIKQKNLIPNELFDKNKIDGLLHYKDNTNSTYYKAILQNIFFASLNLEHGANCGNRVFNKENEDSIGYKYKRFFKDTQDSKFIELCRKIPFLNGGLFEDFEQDGFSNLRGNEKKLIVPDDLFFNPNGKQIGIIELLNKYNFTVEESTPFDYDVSLDPELLGKVFENLLASYNPETAETLRKSTGSFYTPRLVVDYMVNDSLVEYLKNKLTNVANIEMILRKILNYEVIEISDDEFNASHKKQTVEAIFNCKIIDPACGSGAFPMGILQQMVHLLRVLDKDNTHWERILIANVKKQCDDALLSNSSEKRKQLFKDIETSLNKNINSPDYARKLYLIQTCIYGLDIQPIAIQISKLRFFIALIIEQKGNGKIEENFGIRALPNLETKFIAADSLLYNTENFEFGGDIFEDDKITNKFKELQTIRYNHFFASNSLVKLNCINNDKIIRNELADLLKKSISKYTPAELSYITWDPYNLNKPADFFNYKLMFNMDKGFDIVIGNPPYIQLQSMEKKTKYKDCGYETYAQRGDIYQLFYELGLKILVDDGVLCYITSNKWMRNHDGKSTRKFFSKYTPLKLLDLGAKVFEAAWVDTNILIIKNETPDKNLKELSISAFKTASGSGDWRQTLIAAVNGNNYTFIKIPVGQSKEHSYGKDGDIWIINNDIEEQILTKVNKLGTPLGDAAWGIKFNRGITTGFNKAFIIDTAKRDELVALDPKSAKIIKRTLRGKDIEKYNVNWAGLWVIVVKYESNVYLEKKYPIIFNYLKQYKKELQKRGQCRYGGKGNLGQHHWVELDNCPTDEYLAAFEQNMIGWNRIASVKEFALINNFFLVDSMHFVIGDIYKLKFILILLNSNLYQWRISIIIEGAVGGNAGNSNVVKKLPIILLSAIHNLELQQLLFRLSEQILSKKQKDENTLLLEKEVDKLVYALYKLTPEEIDYIEKQITI